MGSAELFELAAIGARARIVELKRQIRQLETKFHLVEPAKPVRHMSKAGRARISQAMKARWAKKGNAQATAADVNVAKMKKR